MNGLPMLRDACFFFREVRESDLREPKIYSCLARDTRNPDAGRSIDPLRHGDHRRIAGNAGMGERSGVTGLSAVILRQHRS